MEYTKNFWQHEGMAGGEGIEEQPVVTPELIREVEEKLHYKLPQSYICLMQTQNGGIPQNAFVSGDLTEVEYIYGIAMEGENSLVEAYGTFVTSEEEKRYPAIGIPICETWGGHVLIFLDYRECGPEGEPKVVEVSEEDDYEITELADDFESFLGLLTTEEKAKEAYERAQKERKSKRFLRREDIIYIEKTKDLHKTVLKTCLKQDLGLTFAVGLPVSAVVTAVCVMNIGRAKGLIFILLFAALFFYLAIQALLELIRLAMGNYRISRDRVSQINEEERKSTGKCILENGGEWGNAARMWDKKLQAEDEVLAVHLGKAIFVMACPPSDKT